MIITYEGRSFNLTPDSKKEIKPMEALKQLGEILADNRKKGKRSMICCNEGMHFKVPTEKVPKEKGEK